MKVPISWLKEYVEFDDTVQGLADKLTFSGVEVEGIETIGGEFPGIVIGKVLSVAPHPNADRLTVCTVTAGGDELQVVCGAPNVRAGMLAAFAPVGATLPNGVTLKKAKIRQVESHGMLLAADELGISDDHSGLMTIAGDWAPGTPLKDVLGPAETVLDLEITPNRPDCLSLIGIAREVASLYNSELKWPEVKITESGAAVETLTRVEVEDTEACPRYTARVLTHIEIKPSPEWMQKRLTLAGIRPINNVVDITNYVMLECGHPLHAFDQALLEEGRIVVRRARAGEKMQTLDEAERELTPEMLVIADARKPVAVAGVMGGAGSEIRDTTTTVLLESACFEPLRTRATSRNLALSTESSYRFERGVDAVTVDWASQRAAALLIEFAGGQLAKGVVDVYPAPAQRHEVTCTWDFIRSVTGMTIDNAAISRILISLGLVFTAQDESTFTVSVPTFRRDLERPVDLVEEVARLHGLDHVPTPLPRAQLAPYAEDAAVSALSELKTTLAGLGLREIMNYSLTAPALLDLFDAEDQAQRIVLPHPISADQSVLRPSLIPQMVETLGRNHARQMTQALFFESGRVYQLRDGQPWEENRMALGLLGPVGRDAYRLRAAIRPDEMFSWMKGLLESLLAAQRIREWSVRAEPVAGLEPGQSVAVWIDGQRAGVMGLVARRIRKEWRLNDPVAVAEISTAALLQHTREIPAAQAVAVFPSMSRDMALVVQQSVSHEDIMAIIRQNAGPELEKIELFDIFEGDAIGAGKKSMAYSVTYRSSARTLTDEEANVYHERVKDAIRSSLDVVIREGA